MGEAVNVFLGTALAAGLLGIPVFRGLVHCGVIDKPNERSSHVRPTARGGGIAIVGSLLAFAIIQSPFTAQRELTWIMSIVVLLAMVSFYDDLKCLSALLRFICQLAAGIAAWAVLGYPPIGIAPFSSHGWMLPTVCGSAVVLLWLVGYTNAFNFMDGINGLAAGQAVIGGIGSGLLAGLSDGKWQDPAVLTSFAIAGAAAGFLPHNVPVPRMFMGDVGSAPLGFVLAVLSIWIARDHGWVLMVPLVLLHTNFILDTGITLFRRILRGDRWYEAHREHFYQKLIRAGKSHAFVTGWEMALQLLVLVLVLFYVNGSVFGRVVVAAGIFLVWGGFFLCCERAFRNAQAIAGELAATQTVSIRAGGVKGTRASTPRGARAR